MTLTQAQHLLAYLQYYTMDVDGLYGPGTKAAITDFQKNTEGLEVDGLQGPKTDQALIDAVANGRFKPQQGGGNTGDASWWKDIKYFKRAEFRCPCPRCGGFPVEPTETLVRTAEQVRIHFGRVMDISSGVRCQAHNDELKGSVPNSRHILGKAIDFSVRGIDPTTVRNYVLTLPNVRYCYIMTSGWVHLDVY